MPKFTRNVVIDDVDRIWRPGLGYVYKGRISIADLAYGLIEGDIKYAPKYQRGQRRGEDEFDAKTLLEITSPLLAIDQKRAEAMATKYLMGDHADNDREFYNPDIIWNARMEPGRSQVEYEKRKLTVHSTITIPDSAHRHYCYYLLYKWHSDPESVPVEVEVSDDGEAIEGEQIREWLQDFDPTNEEKSSTFVTIFNIEAQYEGRLFDEYNVEGKKPTAGAAIDMYTDKTASRRFVEALMKRCPIFDRSEMEMRGSTIAAASRKITTVATLDVAIKPFQKRLLELEKTKPIYDDLIDFFTHYYTEWSKLIPEFQPTASGKARQDLRKTSFAMSNIMFFPMFRLAFELWDKCREAGVDWKTEKEWKTALAKLAGTVQTSANGEKPFTVPVMARDSDESTGNPDWYGKILVQKFTQDGRPAGWSLSSTRQTRDAAYHYLVKVSGVSLPNKAK